jgi:G3E family GTPase
MARAADARIPVLLVTGFLGSGKTTLLNALLRQHELSDAAVIVNEFGPVGVDHHLVEKIDEAVVLLDSGCLCCATHGELASALRELFLRALRREIPPLRAVIVETSGLADVAPVIQTLAGDFFVAERFVLDGVVCCVDVTHVAQQSAAQPEVQAQIVLADVVVLTRADTADGGALARAHSLVAGLNPSAPRLEVAHGNVPAAALLGQGMARLAAPGVSRWLPCPATDGGRHRADVQAHAYACEGAQAWGAFSTALDRLLARHGDAVLRMKGIVMVRGMEGARVLHAVHHTRYPPKDLPDWPEDMPQRPELVFIVRGLERQALEADLPEGFTRIA